MPNEVKRLRGTARADRVPALAEVTILPMAGSTPDPPEDLGLAGRKIWAQAWAEAITWLSPDSDMSTVLEACQIADDLAAARRRFRVTTEPSDGRQVATFSKALIESLAALGFNPTARSRLGLAEVKKVDALESILARRQRPAQ